MQFRDFVIELLRQEVDNVFVGLKARTIGPWPSGKTKRTSEVDVDDFQAFKASKQAKSKLYGELCTIFAFLHTRA